MMNKIFRISSLGILLSGGISGHALADRYDRSPAVLLEVNEGSNTHYGTGFIINNGEYQTGNRLIVTAMHVVNEGSATGHETFPAKVNAFGWNDENFGEAEILFCGRGRMPVPSSDKAQQDICVVSAKNPSFSYDIQPGVALEGITGQ